MTDKRITGIGLILSAALLWGTTGTAQSFAPLSLSSFWVGAMRLLVSGGFFLLWISATDIAALRLTRLRALPWSLVLTASFCMAIYNLAFFAGVRATSVAIGTAIALGSAPVWAGILQAVLSKKLPTRSWWIAIAVAMLGLAVAALGSHSERSELPFKGIALCLLSGLAYAIYAVVTKRVLTFAPAAITTATVFSLAAVLATPAAYALAGLPVLVSSDIIVMLWLGIAATGIAYLLFAVGLRHVSSATGVALALAEPIAAVILAIVIVGERPTTTSLIGLAIVFSGLCMIIRAELSDR